MSEVLDPNRIREVGDWSEQISSGGKRYFYNRVTEVSQWKKPEEWEEAERRMEEARINYANKQAAAAAASSVPVPNQPPPVALVDVKIDNQSDVAMDVVDEEEEEDELPDVKYDQPPPPAPPPPPPPPAIEAPPKMEDPPTCSNASEQLSSNDDEEGQEWRKYYNPQKAEEFSKKIFAGQDPDLYRDLVVSRISHEIRIAEQRTIAHKAETLINASMLQSKILDDRLRIIRESQDELEKARLKFHVE